MVLKPRIGITLGDVNGIGPEVTIKALRNHRILANVTPIVYGASGVLFYYEKLSPSSQKLPYAQVKHSGQYAEDAVNLCDCWEKELSITPGKASRIGGELALLSLRQATKDIKEGAIDAIVTAPIDKHSIYGTEFPYLGHTEYLTKEFGPSDALMMLVSGNLRVGLVTEHTPLRGVASLISAERVTLRIELLEAALKKDFLIARPRIAVFGLNPHAGDGSLLGDEEQNIIEPAINKLREQGKLISGPYPADGFFGARQDAEFDAILAMYHDQGLIGFKTLAFNTGVNYTAGLPIVRTSPDHGTAYNIAGKNKADESSMLEAILLAADIYKNRVRLHTRPCGS